jgi:hypothetical protein
MIMNIDEVSVKLATGDKAKEIMDGFYARNEELKNGKWHDGWVAFCESVPYYKNMPVNAYKEPPVERLNEVFAHYIDCEAHEDVIRYYFKTWHHTNERY